MREEGVTLDALTPEWQVYQYKGGHRFSNDDKLCGWRAAEHAGDRRKCLDIGSGIGSVGLTLLWRLPEEATLCMVEAQERSVALCRRSLAHNGLNERCILHHMDLRDFRSEEKFELITGSPPYIPANCGIASEHSQKAHCRLELRGGLDDYCQAAARLLGPNGRFVFVMTAADSRCISAPLKAGLIVLERFEYKFKGNRSQSHIATIVCGRQQDFGPDYAEPPQLYYMVIREPDNKRTLDYRAWQEYMQIRPNPLITIDSLKDALIALRVALSRFEETHTKNCDSTLTSQHLLSCEHELRAAVSHAESLGIRPTPGSEELSAAKRALLTLSDDDKKISS